MHRRRQGRKPRAEGAEALTAAASSVRSSDARVDLEALAAGPGQPPEPIELRPEPMGQLEGPRPPPHEPAGRRGAR
jgi:hypothetical protein